MNRSEAIAIIRRRGNSSVTPSSFHFANVNAAKDVWWLDIPIAKPSAWGTLTLASFSTLKGLVALYFFKARNPTLK